MTAAVPDPITAAAAVGDRGGTPAVVQQLQQQLQQQLHTQAVGDVLHANGPYSGYWGAPSASVDWCETNYTHSPYVAEWWNTLSSFVIVATAAFGLWVCRKQRYEQRFVVCYALLALVGIGSALFHGTLHWAGQALDELPMVYTSLAFLYVIWQTESAAPPEPPARCTDFDDLPKQTLLNFEHLLPQPNPAPGPSPYAVYGGASALEPNGGAEGGADPLFGGGYAGPYGPNTYGGGGVGLGWWSEDADIADLTANGLILFAGLFTIAYLSSSDFFRWFLALYLLAIVVIFRQSLSIHARASTPAHQKWLIRISFALYGFGFAALWIPGEWLWPCELARTYQLHAWFHVTAAVGPFLWLVMAAWQRLSFVGKRPQLVWHPVTAPLPYVAVPIKSPAKPHAQ